MSSTVQNTVVGSGAVRQKEALTPALAALRQTFPGQTVAGVCFVLAPMLTVAGSLIGMSSYHARGVEFVAGMIAHPTAFNVGAQLAEAGIILLIIAVIALATMICAVRPRWGRIGGVIAVIGLCGPISFESLYWGASHITDTVADRAAAAQMMDESQMIPRTIMNISGPCLVIGFILLAIAAGKSGVLNRWRAACLGATCLIPFGFISGYLVISAVAFVGTLLALVPLGVQLLRRH